MPRAYRACLSCLAGLVLAACGGSTDPDDTGTIETTTVTTGAPPDPDGYTLTVDGDPGRPLGTNATLTLSDLSVGGHQLRLLGVDPHCTLTGSDRRDLTVTAGFLTMPTATQRYQMQGLLFEADANDYVRFDVHSAGSRLYAFASVTVNGVSSSRIRLSVDAANADHLRVTRTGDLWRYEASGDGEIWSVVGSFTHDLALTAAGVFAGSYS